ncbi:MAG TPA: hypothetical protein VKV95_19320 [Terriglobia bacterium]|nr:hypothetical protein [Terriglobia bacterium]
MKARLWTIRPAMLILAAILAMSGGATLAPASPKPQKAEAGSAKRALVKADALGNGASEAQMDPQVMESTRRTFNEVLERYPRLNNVISRDPTLLTNQEYMTTNAPGLWEFLQKHPEIASDPEFFLEGRLRREGFNERDNAPDPVSMRILNDVWPFLVFVIMMGSLLHILRSILENRRWTRLAKVQAEAHSKLLERFGSSQELLAYMSTEPGRKFLESAPIPVDLEPQTKFGAPLSRILWSAQLGFILALGGAGLLYIRGSVVGGDEPLLVFGTLGMTFGIGFILSAAFSYGLSKHLGLFERAENSPTHRTDLGTIKDSGS